MDRNERMRGAEQPPRPKPRPRPQPTAQARVNKLRAKLDRPPNPPGSRKKRQKKKAHPSQRAKPSVISGVLANKTRPVLSVGCPKCRANPRHRCKNKLSDYVPSHSNRYRAAQRAYDEDQIKLARAKQAANAETRTNAQKNQQRLRADFEQRLSARPIEAPTSTDPTPSAALERLIRETQFPARQEPITHRTYLR